MTSGKSRCNLRRFAQLITERLTGLHQLRPHGVGLRQAWGMNRVYRWYQRANRRRGTGNGLIGADWRDEMAADGARRLRPRGEKRAGRGAERNLVRRDEDERRLRACAGLPAGRTAMQELCRKTPGAYDTGCELHSHRPPQIVETCRAYARRPEAAGDTRPRSARRYICGTIMLWRWYRRRPARRRRASAAGGRD